MIGRWFFLAVVAIGLTAIVRAPHGAPAAAITQSCAPVAPNVAEVTVARPSGADASAALSVDLSLAPGFVATITHSAGVLAAGDASLALPPLPLGAKLYYRLKDAANDKVVASGSFSTRCGTTATAVAD